MQVVLLRHGIAVSRDDPACPPEAARVLCVGPAPHLDPVLAQGIRAGQGRIDPLVLQLQPNALCALGQEDPPA